MDELEALNAAMSRYDDMLSKATTGEAKKHDKVVLFLREFENVAQTTIKPAFEKVLVDLIRAREHDGSVSVKPFNEDTYLSGKQNITSANVTLYIAIKGMQNGRGNEPHVFFNARSDNADSRQINAIYNMFSSGALKNGVIISPGIGDQISGGSYKLEEITAEVVRAEAIRFLTILFQRMSDKR